jgi:hypothetical protein
MQNALRRFGLRKTTVGLMPFVGFFSATFCPPWSLLRKALIRAGKTSYTAGTLDDIRVKMGYEYILQKSTYKINGF